jgi:hypothetical protein
LAIVTTATAVLAVGCSTTQHDSTGSPGLTRPATNRGPGAPTSAVNACSLLSASEVTAVIGPNDGAKPTAGKNPDTSECTWSHETTSPPSLKAIRLNVSEADTASGDQVPPPALGTPPPVSGVGSGARLLLVGTLEFPAGDRVCEVQVTGLGDDAAKQAAIQLAGLVRGRA